jgi:hypothetical protein
VQMLLTSLLWLRDHRLIHHSHSWHLHRLHTHAASILRLESGHSRCCMRLSEAVPTFPRTVFKEAYLAVHGSLAFPASTIEMPD